MNKSRGSAVLSWKARWCGSPGHPAGINIGGVHPVKKISIAIQLWGIQIQKLAVDMHPS